MVAPRQPGPPPAALARLSDANRPVPDAPFDFSAVAAPDRKWLRRAAAEIRARCRRTSADLLAIGRLLLLARRRLGYGGFGRWADREVGLSPRTRRRLMRVAAAFGLAPGEAVRRIAPTALYALSEPEVPQSFREYLVGEVRADPAREVSAAEVRQLLESHRDAAQAPLSLARSKDPPRGDVEADDVHAAENWKLLKQMLRAGVSLHLTGLDDTDGGEGPVSFTRLGAAKSPECVVRPSLEACLLALTEQVRAKKCGGLCQLVKPLTEFSKRRDCPDGRNRYCLACERARVKRAAAKGRPPVVTEAGAILPTSRTGPGLRPR